MKKALFLLCMAAGLMSCTNEILDPGKEYAQNEGVPMTFNVTVLETKAAKTDWTNGDKIYVFFNGLETKYLILSYDDSKWTNTSGGSTLLSTDFDDLGTKNLTAVHFPAAVDVTYADSKFSFTSGGKPVYNYYLFETGKDYTVSGTTVTATLSMGKPANMVQIHVAGIQESVSDYTFGCSKIKPVACASVGIDGAITESVLQAGARVSGLADSDGGIFAGRLVYPGETKDYTFTIASNTHIYTLTRTGESAKALTAGKMYNFPALPASTDANWTVQNASDLYVDLGISVGGKKIYWAKCNVGADSETGYGDYFAWGEILPKANYAADYSNYAWVTDSRYTKYCGDPNYGIKDDLITLQPEDDAAYAALGGKFRMPTREELEALKNLPNEWVTNYNGSGINGYKFTGNGQTIFLPAAGYKVNTSTSEIGSQIFYWSSSIADPRFGHCLGIVYSAVSVSYQDRYRGQSVRPVYE